MPILDITDDIPPSEVSQYVVFALIPVDQILAEIELAAILLFQ